MKTLYLVRHANAEKKASGMQDIDRPLSNKGYREAYLMSELFNKEQHQAHLLVSSPAVRAVSTALVFARTFNYPVNQLMLHDGIYEAANHTLLKIIRHFDDKVDRVMLFGHNPVITTIGELIAVSPADHMPTAAILGLEFKVNSWKEVGEKEKGATLYFKTPKTL